MPNKNRRLRFVKIIRKGGLLCLALVLAAFLVPKGTIVGQLILYETMPDYSIFPSEAHIEVAEWNLPVAEDDVLIDYEQPDVAAEEVLDIIGLYDVVFQSDTPSGEISESHFMQNAINLNNLSGTLNFDYLRQNIYIVEAETGMSQKDFDASHLLSADLRLGGDIDKPQVLIFNTHPNELFSDSKNKSEGVEALSIRLCQILNKEYGIRAVYTTGDFDRVDGKPQILGAYERMEPVISKLLKENPSIEVAIDIHRDGLDDGRRLVTTIDGKPTAQLMFVNGLSKISNKGTLQDVAHLPNPNLKANLAFSLQMQMTAASLYPDSNLMRKIYLKPYRYSLHMLPKSLLVEVGAQTNTQEEALNALYPLAEMLAGVLGK